MKRLKQIIASVKAESTEPDLGLIWHLICYSPKMPVRLQQQNLLDASEKFCLQAYDEFFTGGNLSFNVFKWGNGSRLVILTHGWGSKATDFTELISELMTVPNVTVVAFDAPGNGSSEGELSNGELFANTVSAVIKQFGMPDVLIGHSLGCMANVLALSRATELPRLLISITPLIRLKDNFIATMTSVGVNQKAQAAFFDSFKKTIGGPTEQYDQEKLYKFGSELDHIMLYDEADLISPYPYIRDFLSSRPFIRAENYNGAGHERIIKSPEAIKRIVDEVKNV